MTSQNKERLKVKIQHVLDAVKAIQELERNVALCVSQDVGSTPSDPSAVRGDAAKAKAALYHHLTDLTKMLLTAEGAKCITVSNPESDKDRALLKMVAEVIIGGGGGHDGEDERGANKTGEKEGVFTRCGNWVLERAAVCGRELTGFCDLWLAITTVLLVVKLCQRYSIDMAEMAREHKEAMGNVKDISFTSKKK